MAGGVKAWGGQTIRGIGPAMGWTPGRGGHGTAWPGQQGTRRPGSRSTVGSVVPLVTSDAEAKVNQAQPLRPSLAEGCALPDWSAPGLEFPGRANRSGEVYERVVARRARRVDLKEA